MSLNSDTFETEKRRYVRQKCEADTPGATIVIRLGKVLSSKIESTDHEYPRLVSLGEVAWQTTFSGGHRSYFRAGIRYPITA